MLSDIEAELVESNYHAAHDEELAAHLDASPAGFYLNSPAVRCWFTSS